MTIAEYIKELLSKEEYAFSLNEIRQYVGKSEIPLKKELERLAVKEEIVNLRKGFYLIIPPRYSSVKKLPIQLYCNKLFDYLGKKYYVGLFSAARFHGASHQQLQRDYIVTAPPKLRDISKKNINVRFFTTSNWSEKNIQLKKSDAGYYKISSPALTIVDLIHYQTKLGGINRILATIEELAEELTEADMSELLSWYPSKSTLQRLGFLLEELRLCEEHQELIYNRLKQTNFSPVLLTPKTNEKAGAVNNKWEVDVNVKMESDL